MGANQSSQSKSDNINEKGLVNYNTLYKCYSYFNIIIFHVVNNPNKTDPFVFRKF